MVGLARRDAEEECYMLVLTGAPPQLGLIPHLWWIWSGLLGLPESKVLCCRSFFRLTNILNFPVFLSSRMKEQGQVVGQAATLLREMPLSQELPGWKTQ